MSDSNIFHVVQAFNSETLKNANSEIITAVADIIFMLFEEIEAPGGDEELREKLADTSWGIAALCLAVSGMQMFGENSDGDYVATFSPYGSIENFAIKNNIANND